MDDDYGDAGYGDDEFGDVDAEVEVDDAEVRLCRMPLWPALKRSTHTQSRVNLLPTTYVTNAD